MINFLDFQRPQRYIGNEGNVYRKPLQGKIRICLPYPDLYEVGMSNLGLRIIYGFLNEQEDVACERVFMPGEDMADFLKKERESLFSLETRSPMQSFDVLGFHLGYELNVINFLYMLSLGKVSLGKEERENLIVLAGGIMNPEPLAEFVDVFYLGEFEAGAEPFLEILRRHKGKNERLDALSQIPGFYVPEFYSFDRNHEAAGPNKSFPQAQYPLKRVHVRDLDSAYYPSRWLVPLTSIVHDRAQVEIARGCPNSCNFCQAQAVYFPYRERSKKRIKELITEIYKNSGYENISLLSLSASDYSCIESLIDEVHGFCKINRIGLSLPSLRIDDITGRLYKQLSLLKKTSLTVALEAAESPLRCSLNKNIDIDKLFQAALIARKLGMRHIKIYFMYGFEQEKESDLRAIGKLLDKLRSLSKLNIHASINAFIPKPFSAWESFSMQTEAILQDKRQLILESIPRRKDFKVSFMPIKKSLIEAAISRSGRSFSKVIYNAYMKGARFDGHSEKFSWNIWQESLDCAGVKLDDTLDCRGTEFPWSFIKKNL